MVDPRLLRDRNGHLPYHLAACRNNAELAEMLQPSTGLQLFSVAAADSAEHKGPSRLAVLAGRALREKLLFDVWLPEVALAEEQTDGDASNGTTALHLGRLPVKAQDGKGSSGSTTTAISIARDCCPSAPRGSNLQASCCTVPFTSATSNTARELAAGAAQQAAVVAQDEDTVCGICLDAQEAVHIVGGRRGMGRSTGACGHGMCRTCAQQLCVQQEAAVDCCKPVLCPFCRQAIAGFGPACRP